MRKLESTTKHPIKPQNSLPFSKDLVEHQLLSLGIVKRSPTFLQEILNIQAHLKKRTQKIHSQTNFNFIDLFAGIGGMRLAFENMGGRCVMTSELDRHALATYYCNFGELVEEKYRDITQVPNKIIPSHDILLGGFPCQAFSVAGERKGFQDTRGTLFFEIERILKAKKPKAFLLENVKGLLSHDHGRTFHTILQSLEKKLNYQVFFKVLNTKDYCNIPQTRERIYIVGFNRSHSTQEIHFQFPTPMRATKNIQDFLEKSQINRDLFYDKFDIHKILDKEITRTDTLYQWRRKYVRENKSNSCPTLTANMGTGGHNVPLIREEKSKKIRKISPRECANFQGFPKDYYLPSFLAHSHLYKQIGNSVSVPVIQRIAEQMIQTLQSMP